MARPYTCSWFGASGESVSSGIRRTKTMGNRALAVCEDCRRKFNGTTSPPPPAHPPEPDRVLSGPLAGWTPTNGRGQEATEVCIPWPLNTSGGL